MTHWIVVGNPENFELAREQQLGFFGFKSTRRREASQMQPGDTLIFYLTGIMKLGGIATVTSDSFEDHNRVFKSEKKPGEDYPFRVRIEPDLFLTSDRYLDVREIAPRLEYTKRWPAEHWRLAFQGNLHQIPESDYLLIRREVEDAVKVGSS